MAQDKMLQKSLNLISTSGRVLIYGATPEEKANLEAWPNPLEMLVIPTPELLEQIEANPGTSENIDLVKRLMNPIAEFREGTFSFDGEAPTLTPLNYESGKPFYTAVGAGTESFSGEIPDFSIECLEYLANAKYITGIDGLLKGKEGVQMGETMPVLRGCVIVVEFIGGDYDFFIYPNGTVVSSKTGSLSSDNCLSLLLNVSSQPAQKPASLVGENIIIAKSVAAAAGVFTGLNFENVNATGASVVTSVSNAATAQGSEFGFVAATTADPELGGSGVVVKKATPSITKELRARLTVANSTGQTGNLSTGTYYVRPYVKIGAEVIYGASDTVVIPAP